MKLGIGMGMGKRITCERISNFSADCSSKSLYHTAEESRWRGTFCALVLVLSVNCVQSFESFLSTVEQSLSYTAGQACMRNAMHSPCAWERAGCPR